MTLRKIWYPIAMGLLLVGCSKCPTLPEGSSNRTVLAEFFSFVGCTFCPNAEEAIHHLKTEYGDSLAVLVYHMRMLGDTLSPEDAQARAVWYGVSAAPTAFFDGGSKSVGASTVELAYDSYKEAIVTRRSVPSSIQMSMEASLTATNIQIDCEIVVLDEVSGEFELRLVLFQDSVFVGDSQYDFVVRSIEGEDLSFSGSDTFHTTFDFPNRWGGARLGAVGFVQNEDTKEVLQATVIGMTSPSLPYDFSLVCLDDTFQTVSVDTEAVFRFTLENKGTLNDVYELSLAVVDSVAGWFESYCFGGVCLLPAAVGQRAVSAGESDNTISVHVLTVGQPGLEVVCFKAKSLGDTTLIDSVYLHILADGAVYRARFEDMSFAE